MPQYYQQNICCNHLHSIPPSQNDDDHAVNNEAVAIAVTTAIYHASTPIVPTKPIPVLAMPIPKTSNHTTRALVEVDDDAHLDFFEELANNEMDPKTAMVMNAHLSASTHMGYNSCHCSIFPNIGMESHVTGRVVIKSKIDLLTF